VGNKPHQTGRSKQKGTKLGVARCEEKESVQQT